MIGLNIKKGFVVSIETDIFQKFSPDFDKLVNYGFKKQRNKYIYEKLFLNDEFKAVVEIDKNGKVMGTVYDLENNDEFLPLRVEYQEGSFVGKVRDEYIRILTDIREKCFSENYFLSPQSNRLAKRIFIKYGNKPEFLWEQSPNCGVFRGPNNKWYGIIMDVNALKLGERVSKLVDVINIKLDKEKIQKLLEKTGFYPAYHMNKKSWITIVLDETLSDNEILDLIDESYSNVGTK